MCILLIIPKLRFPTLLANPRIVSDQLLFYPFAVLGTFLCTSSDTAYLFSASTSILTDFLGAHGELQEL